MHHYTKSMLCDTDPVSAFTIIGSHILSLIQFQFKDILFSMTVYPLSLMRSSAILARACSKYSVSTVKPQFMLSITIYAFFTKCIALPSSFRSQLYSDHWRDCCSDLSHVSHAKCDSGAGSSLPSAACFLLLLSSWTPGMCCSVTSGMSTWIIP